MINIAIFDDDIYQLDTVHKKITDILNTKNIFFHIDTYSDLDTLQKECVTKKYNIYVLDINADGKNATTIPFALKINQMDDNAEIIFITGHIDYFPDVYVCKHVYCILKDEIDEHLSKALTSAIDAVSNKKMTSVPIKTMHNIVMVKARNIIYLEKNLRRIKFVLSDNSILYTYASFDDYMYKLPKEFVRIHRSFIVNTNYIKSIENNLITLTNGEIITVSRTYQKKLLQILFQNYVD